MIQLFTKLLPYILLFYFLYRSVNEPIYIIGVPFLMFFRNSLFIEKVQLLQYPYDERSDIFLIAWLTVCWAFFLIRSKKNPDNETYDNFKISGVNVLDYCIIFLMVISAIGLTTVLSEYYIINDVYIEFLILISLFLGFFIMKSVVKQTERKVLAEFLFHIVLINSIASVLYILHQGLHIVIYQGEELFVEVVQGETITRTFWFAPVLWYFSIFYLLVFKNLKSLPILGLLAINILSLFLSYSRSALLMVLLLVFLYYILIAWKNRDYTGLVKKLALIFFFGIVFFQGVSYFLPANTNYFMNRFDDIQIDPNDKQSNTLVQRFTNTGEVIGDITDRKLIFGFGPVTETQLSLVENMRAVTADMVWTGVIFRWGYSGMVLFIILYLASIIKAFNLFKHGEGIMSDFGLLFLLIILSQVITSFVSWSFLSPTRFALGLWYLGMLSGLIQIKNKLPVITDKKQIDDNI